MYEMKRGDKNKSLVCDQCVDDFDVSPKPSKWIGLDALKQDPGVPEKWRTIILEFYSALDRPEGRVLLESLDRISLSKIIECNISFNNEEDDDEFDEPAETEMPLSQPHSQTSPFGSQDSSNMNDNMQIDLVSSHTSAADRPQLAAAHSSSQLVGGDSPETAEHGEVEMNYRPMLETSPTQVFDAAPTQIYPQAD